ncbi:MAG: hypothetical protein JXD23_11255 [Spirochaetales bacterium]|nr:hypothetical protein [Spirochaetales bacterium]
MESNAYTRTAIVRTVKNAPAGYLDLTIEEPAIAGAARPGQFVMLRFGRTLDPILPRPFDIVETVGNGRSFRLIIKIVGAATRLLESVRTGDEVRVTGPLGAPITDFNCRSLALLVRGCGAAAVIAFLQEARRRGIAVHSVLSASSASKFILRDEFAALSDTLILATDDGSAGEKALGTDVLRRLLAERKVDRVYSCGGGPFYLPFLEEWERSKISPVYLFLESYMACGFGHCHGCAVPRRDGGYSLVCRDGPLFRLSEVKDPCLIYQ